MIRLKGCVSNNYKQVWILACKAFYQLRSYRPEN